MLYHSAQRSGSKHSRLLLKSVVHAAPTDGRALPSCGCLHETLAAHRQWLLLVVLMGRSSAPGKSYNLLQHALATPFCQLHRSYECHALATVAQQNHSSVTVLSTLLVDLLRLCCTLQQLAHDLIEQCTRKAHPLCSHERSISSCPSQVALLLCAAVCVLYCIYYAAGLARVGPYAAAGSVLWKAFCSPGRFAPSSGSRSVASVLD